MSLFSFSSTDWGEEGSPFKPNDWVFNGHQIAQVKDVFKDKNSLLLNLVLYSHNGEKIGRETPAFNGPRTFEPCCDATNWERISRPDFPVGHEWRTDPENPTRKVSHIAVRELPPGKFFPRKKRVVVVRVNDLPEIVLAEAYALRRAAQELRDMARAMGIDQVKAKLITRAEQLEREAKALQ